MGNSSGFYARLGLSPAATAADIKSAYRRLAKECHPDAGGVTDGGLRFRAATEAYETLSDPDRRASYDSASAAGPVNKEPEQSSSRIEPIRCGTCGNPTAQPRYIVFRHVVSFIFSTLRTPVQGIFCSACANKAALKATLISAVAGWWGFPWGPIYTVMDSIRNASGGTHAKENEERLQCHNAWAFASQGNTRLSYAIAERLLSASSADIVTSAESLINFLNTRGFTKPANNLKDSWQLQPKSLFLHGLMIAALPLAGVLMFYTNDRPSASNMALNFYTRPLSDPLPIEHTTSNAAEPSVPAKTVPTCADLPANGAKLAGRLRLGKPGHVIDIQNGSEGDAIVKIRDAASDKLVASFFVRQNQSARFKGIPDGVYRIQYASGAVLAENCKSFTTTTAEQFPDVESLVTERRINALGQQIIRMRLSYTLYSVPAGNVRPEKIDASAFNND